MCAVISESRSTNETAGGWAIDNGELPSRRELVTWLLSAAPWSGGTQLVDVVPCRVWVSRDRRITFELRLALQTKRVVHHALLQGGLGAVPFVEPSLSPRVTNDGWLAGLRMSDDIGGVWCCSPELDGALPGTAALWPRAFDEPPSPERSAEDGGATSYRARTGRRAKRWDVSIS